MVFIDDKIVFLCIVTKLYEFHSYIHSLQNKIYLLYDKRWWYISFYTYIFKCTINNTHNIELVK